MNWKSDFPMPGDLIVVDKSEWYALSDGETLRVCETPHWCEPTTAVYVAPRKQVRSFWGPSHGSPDGIQPLVMSTSGGPFKTIPAEELEGLSREATVSDTFWHWIDWPRAGGGVDYQREVTLWRLPQLIDHHHRRMEHYRKEVSHD